MGWSRGGKSTTEGYHRIDVGYLLRHGNLRPGTVFALSWSRNERQTGSIQGRATWNSVMTLPAQNVSLSWMIENQQGRRK